MSYFNIAIYILEFFFLVIFIHPIVVAFMVLLVRRSPTKKLNTLKQKFAIIIPSYREGNVLVHNIDSLKKQNYPVDRFKIFLINDNCDSAVIEQLRNSNVKIIDVSFPKSSKVKSLQSAYTHVGDKFDSVIVIDSDNLAHPNFLKEINLSLANGSVFVQGKRIAKNLDSLHSRLDYLTDIFYNFIDREWLNHLNLSATISGSGFGMERKLFFDVINKIDVFGGFDKMIQLILIKNGYKIDFNPDAIIYDEKVSESGEMRKQRKRWIHAHMRMIATHTQDILKSIVKKITIDKLNYLFIILRPPLTILVFIAIFFCVFNIFLKFHTIAFIWTGILFAYFLILLTTLILSKVDLKMYLVLLASPLLLLNQLLSIFNIKEAAQNSLHTSHSSVLTINDILSKEKK